MCQLTEGILTKESETVSKTLRYPYKNIEEDIRKLLTGNAEAEIRSEMKEMSKTLDDVGSTATCHAVRKLTMHMVTSQITESAIDGARLLQVYTPE